MYKTWKAIPPEQNQALSSKSAAKCWAAVVLSAFDRFVYLQVFLDLYLQVF